MEQWELPEGWSVEPLSTNVTHVKGKRPKFLSEVKSGTLVPYIDIKAFEKNQVTFYGDKNSAKLANKGDLLIVWDGARSGLVGKMPFDGAVGSTIAVLLVSKAIITDYLFRFLESKFEILNLNTKGSGIPHLDPDILWNLEFPISPLPEQKRIVAKVEALLALVNAARERLEKVSAILKRFRQSVLAAACSGRLTEDWREINHKSKLIDIKNHSLEKALKEFVNLYELYELPDKWGWYKINDIGVVKGGKRLPRGKKLVKENTGYPYLKAGDLKNGTVNPANIEYLEKEIQDKIKNYTVKKGDVYITIVGACIGDAGIIPDEFDEANLTENAAKITDFSNVSNTFVAIWLRSPVCQEFIKNTVLSAAQGKLALGRIKMLPIPISPIDEQHAIVHRVEALFKLADTIESQVNAAKQRVDKLTQAILVKAFRGELVPTEAELARQQGREYETAAELLERIQKAKEI